MITEGINGIDVDLSYRVGQDAVDVIGHDRMALIDEVLSSSLCCQVNASFKAASTGALRWIPGFRPEVMIDATGRLL